MTLAALVSLALTLATVQPSVQTPSPTDASLIRVRIDTDPGGIPDELAARRESVAHLLAAVRANKKSGIVIVTRPDDPTDVIVDVADRGVTVPKVVVGLNGGTGSPNGRMPTNAVRVVQLRVTVTLARDVDPVEIKNKNHPNETTSGWQSAAEDIAKQLDKWIAEHRDAIIQARRRTSQ